VDNSTSDNTVESGLGGGGGGGTGSALGFTSAFEGLKGVSLAGKDVQEATKGAKRTRKTGGQQKYQ